MAGVLCLGSINRDLVYRVEHIVRPGETLAAHSQERHPGGKGANQSVALARAGARVRHCGRVGVDGDDLIGLLATEGIDVGAIGRDDGATGHAIIQLADDGENAIVIAPGANARIPATAVEQAIAAAPAGEILLTQNETAQVATAIRAAAARGMPVWFNPAPYDSTVGELPLDLVDTLVVNRSEAAGLAGLAEADPPAALLDRLADRLPRARLILTLGGEGVIAREGGGDTIVQPAIPTTVVDTTAAGDTFIGYCLARTLAGDPLATALAVASRAAALTVAQQGAIPAIPYAAQVG